MKEESKLEIRKSYPAVLIDVTFEYDAIRDVYKVRFKYRVYLSTSEWIEVFDDFYWWNCANYKKYTLDKIIRVMEAYNLRLLPKDYRNEIVFTKAFKWLIGTRVEISPYRYKGKRYKIVCTERSNEHRIDILWKCLRQDDVDNFLYRLISGEEFSPRFCKELDECYEMRLKQESANLPDPFEGIEELFESHKKNSKSERKKKK